MILSADFDDSNGKVHKLFKMIETLGRFGSWWKTSSFYSAECSLSNYFTKLINVSAGSPQAVRELAETSTKDLNIWRVLLSSCSNCGVLLSWVFWQGGSVAAGETTRAGNFETSNPLTKCQKSTQRVARVSVVLPSYFRTLENSTSGNAITHIYVAKALYCQGFHDLALTIMILISNYG